MMVIRRRMTMIMIIYDYVDDVDDLRGGEGGRGVPFSWSFRDKGPNPPLCFAK